ncbi:hypothetical protein SanaruYs_11190 [Chryseotalea sanaruensis]|uniref:Uncharacterized protein n=1 Tax=Chryseotalea sanaruensis TaxID=2482724 RepID=A0A401U7N2_9BACT|nr:hypothetical protein [Chryseotalea sanaruensis]GCC50900.1 hypothetical protein SanaruYs_11190 [Chryseotalea sanaruensis]
MKKIKSLEELKKFEIKNQLGIRGGQYWDTSTTLNGEVKRDHTCPNGNVLIEQ